MKISFNESKAEVAVVPFFEGPNLATKVGEKVSFSPVEFGDFRGKKGEVFFAYQGKERFLLLGFGKRDQVSSEVVREAVAEAVKVCQNKGLKKVKLFLLEKSKLAREELILAYSEGLFLSNYAFKKLKHDSLKGETFALIEESIFVHLSKEEQKLVEKTKTISFGVNLARDLINSNADEATPQMIAKEAKKLKGIEVEVFDKKRIEKEKMGLLLAVNQASQRDPVFLILNYSGKPGSKDVTALIGKGITYDTGGLSLKTSTGMDSMKADMAGAAVVIGIMQVISSLKLKVNVTGLIPLTENAIGPKSYKPGDVFIGMSGKSVEVVNTDAEGRLILADAISYAVSKIKPSRIIDIATLTGGIIVALGEDVAGLFTDDEILAKKLNEASNRTGEAIWRLPLYKSYLELLKSDIADIKNAGEKSKASSITAALFLKEFVKDFPWAHLDIAGAFFDKPKRYHTTRASGMGVRLLAEFFEKL